MDNCFIVFSESKAFHGIIFEGKSFTITFCKPCNLFVNLWTSNFCSVQKWYNGFNKVSPNSQGWVSTPRWRLWLVWTIDQRDNMYVNGQICDGRIAKYLSLFLKVCQIKILIIKNTTSSPIYLLLYIKGSNVTYFHEDLDCMYLSNQYKHLKCKSSPRASLLSDAKWKALYQQYPLLRKMPFSSFSVWKSETLDRFFFSSTLKHLVFNFIICFYSPPQAII